MKITLDLEIKHFLYLTCFMGFLGAIFAIFLALLRSEPLLEYANDLMVIGVKIGILTMVTFSMIKFLREQ